MSEMVCVSCGRVLTSSISRGYHHSRHPAVGLCGMCARERKLDSHSKGEDES
jgi:hypothetical protein